MYLLATNPILAFAAIIPAIILIVKIYKADKVDKEPVGLLVSLVILGIISTAIALVLEEAGSGLLGLFFKENSLAYNIIMYFGVVACSEEGAKYILLKKRTWRSKEFDYLFDGVVYAVCVSLGFALWENIGYVAKFGISVALLRAITAVPGHACFGVFMGIYYGIAKMFDNRHNEGRSKSFRNKAFWVPVFMHGLYDFLASSKSTFSGLGFLVFIIFMFVYARSLVKRQSKADVNIQQVMPPEGLFNNQNDNDKYN
ncbi:MAG: PrsW family intramembrane metalloprotease [Clostridia bacterium]|nr:PrsW family intramembrane metalloprotease [Clostridia bacterium]